MEHIQSIVDLVTQSGYGILFFALTVVGVVLLLILLRFAFRLAIILSFICIVYYAWILTTGQTISVDFVKDMWSSKIHNPDEVIYGDELPSEEELIEEENFHYTDGEYYTIEDVYDIDDEDIE